MDGKGGEDGNSEEAAADDDNTPAIINGINNRLFPCEGGKDGAEIHRRPVVGIRAGSREKDIVTGGNKTHNNQLADRWCNNRYTYRVL